MLKEAGSLPRSFSLSTIAAAIMSGVVLFDVLIATMGPGIKAAARAWSHTCMHTHAHADRVSCRQWSLTTGRQRLCMPTTRTTDCVYRLHRLLRLCMQTTRTTETVYPDYFAIKSSFWI